MSTKLTPKQNELLTDMMIDICISLFSDWRSMPELVPLLDSYRELIITQMLTINSNTSLSEVQDVCAEMLSVKQNEMLASALAEYSASNFNGDNDFLLNLEPFMQVVIPQLKAITAVTELRTGV